MAIVAGFDVHRAQITFDALNQETGEVHVVRCDRGRHRLGDARNHAEAVVVAAPLAPPASRRAHERTQRWFTRTARV
jgi:hypothetical protein